MELTSLPPPFNLSGNFPIIYGTADPEEAMLVDLFLNGEFVVRERYVPDADGILTIDLGEVISTKLELQMPAATDQVFHQNMGYGLFGFWYGDGIEPPVSEYFTVIKGGSSASIPNTTAFLNQNFLTWQAQTKKIKQTDPEYLTYFPMVPVTIKVKAYFASSPAATAELIELPAEQLTTFSVKYSIIDSLFPNPPTSPLFYDVWAENAAGTRLSSMQRYELTKEYFEFESLFLFENTIGGIDSIRFTGECTEQDQFTMRKGVYDKITRDYNIRNLKTFKQNTGTFRSMAERRWAVEFFKSLQKYLSGENRFTRIYVTEVKLESIKNKMNDGEFEYAVSLDDQYYSVERETAELAAPHLFPIEIPDETIFTDEFTDEYQ